MTTIMDVLRSAWKDFLTGVQAFLPHLLAMLSLVLVGLLIAWVLSFLLRHLLRWLRLNALADRVGVTTMLKKVALPPASDVVASMTFWVVWTAFLLSGLEALGLSGTEDLASGFVAFLPRLAVGIIILVVGLIAANFSWRAALLAAVHADLPSARLLSAGVRWLIIALTVSMALEQIGVAETILLTALAITFGGVMLGVAIAIGIGGGPVARRLMERQFRKSSKDEASRKDELSHL